MLGSEPTLIIYAVLAALNAGQVAAISMSNWAHVLVVAVSAGLAALVNRSQVTPVAKLTDPAFEPAAVKPPAS